MRIVIALAAGLLTLAAITTVAGHAAPERFDPAPGAVLDAAPGRVDGWFTQDIRRQGEASFIRVFDADGNQVDDGSPVIDDADRRHVYVELQSSLENGRYLVAWQTLSDEDDELDGSCFLFFVGQAAADAAHVERLRINAPVGCPVNIEEATALFAKPEIDATVTINVPEEIEGRDVTVNLLTEGAEIRVPTGEGQDPNFAHYHLFLDITPNLTHAHDGENGEPTNPNDIMIIADSYTFRELEPGNHVVTAALFYDDHSPFDPPVTAGASFTVPGGGDGGGDVWVPIVVGVAALAVGGGLAFALRRR